jgi:hypothetical protein
VAAWIRVLAFLPLILAGRMRRAERRTIARLKDAGATVAERGVLLQRDGVINEFVVRRLERAGVVKDAGNDRYYWDGAAYERLRGARRRRAAVVFGLLLLIAAALYFRGDFSS